MVLRRLRRARLVFVGAQSGRAFWRRCFKWRDTVGQRNFVGGTAWWGTAPVRQLPNTTYITSTYGIKIMRAIQMRDVRSNLITYINSVLKEDSSPEIFEQPRYERICGSSIEAADINYIIPAYRIRNRRGLCPFHPLASTYGIQDVPHIMLGNAGRKLCAGLADIQWPLVSPVVCSRPLASPVTARRPTLVRQLASLHQRLGCRAWSSSLSATLLRDRPQNCCSDIWSPCARGSHTPLSRCFSSRRQYGLTRDRKAIAAHAVHAIHAQRRGIIWLVRGSQQWPKRSRAPEKFALGAYGGGRRWRSRQAKMKSDNAREGKGNNSHSTPGDPSPNQTHLLQRLPHMPHIHRPTREELLAAATGFWARLKVRFKWFSIRSLRPFNTDDISAFFSWVLVGHLIWILVGTTTFFSIVVFTVNTVFAQGMHASTADIARCR